MSDTPDRSEILPVDNPYPHVLSGCGSRDCPACAWDHSIITRQSENPYRHDHNPLNADFHGGICSACEWERDGDQRPVHHCVNYHEWFGPPFPTCPICQAPRVGQAVEDAVRVLSKALATVAGRLTPGELREVTEGLAQMAAWVRRNTEGDES